MSDGIVAEGTDAVQAVGAALSYIWGQCTRWVAEQLAWVQSGWGNAYQWLGNAQRAGFQTIGPTLSPPVGSIAVWGPQLPGSGGFGHVAEVVGTSATGFQVSEENWLGVNRTDIRNVSNVADLSGFILPPDGAIGTGSTVPLLSPGPGLPNNNPNLRPGGSPGGGGLGLPNPFDALGNIGGGIATAGAELGGAISGLPADIGHGLANAGVGLWDNAKVFAARNLVALLVAAVVVVVVFL